MSIMFFAPKIYALIHIPASETSRPFATYVARARSPREDYPLASLEGVYLFVEGRGSRVIFFSGFVVLLLAVGSFSAAQSSPVYKFFPDLVNVVFSIQISFWVPCREFNNISQT